MRHFLWGAITLMVVFEVGAATPTQVVVRDIRQVGNGQCVASVTVRYNEPYERMSESPRLLRSSRQAVPCAIASKAADHLTRQLETALLVQAQGQVNDDNTRVRTFSLAAGVPVRAEATFRSPVLRRWTGKGEVQARSVTPSWYAVTDANGNPTEGYFHVSAIVAEVAEPQPVLGVVAASCNARLRSAPNADARIVKNLRCGQALNVIVKGQDGWYEVVSADGAPQGRYINSTALKPAPATSINSGL